MSTKSLGTRLHDLYYIRYILLHFSEKDNLTPVYCLRVKMSSAVAITSVRLRTASGPSPQNIDGDDNRPSAPDDTRPQADASVWL